MVRRLGAALAVLVLSGGLAAVPSTARADDVLVVPGDFHGSSSVTANVPVATAPYLQVTLSRPGYLMSASTPVTANVGPGMTIPVETWGFDDDVTSVSIVGCSGPDPASCSEQLGSVSASIDQVDPASAEIDAPSAPFYFPTEQVTVTAHNAGDGVMRATVDGDVEDGVHRTTLHQVVATDTPTVLDLTDVIGERSGSRVVVQRCSFYAPTVCEAPVAHTTATFLARIEAHVVRTDSSWGIAVTDPGLRNTALHINDYGPGGPFSFDASWTLEDTAGSTVLGPVEAGHGSGLVQYDLDLARGETAGLEGDYVLRFTNTVQTPDGPRSDSVTHPVELVQDPPPTTPPTGSVIDDVLRIPPPGFSSYADRDTEFTVPVIDRGADFGYLVVRDPRGEVVYRMPADQIGPSARAYDWHWDGYGFNNRFPLPRGRYSASAVIHDRYGRRVTVPLGTVRDYGPAEKVRQVLRRVSTRLVAPTHGTRSQTFRVRLPRVPGQWLSEVRPSVRTTGPSGLFRVSMRIPGLSDGWITRGHPWSGGGAHQQVPTAGVPVQVRVATTRAGGIVPLAKVGVEATYWRWAL